MEELISVIVPIYKVESYLNRCVQSIVDQTYKNLEIILVDDGSPDHCPQICEQWKERDKRIKVIHKENGGLSDARNAGLTIRTGQYICFVDSDDWIHREYIVDLYNSLKENNASISACDICITDKKINDNFTCDYVIEQYNTEQALKTLIQGVKFRAVVWNKLYSADVIKDEFFEVGKFHEDEFFTYRVIAKAKKLVYIEKKLYYYFQRNGSIMASISSKHLDILDAYLNRIEFLNKRFKNLYYIGKLNYCITCIYLYDSMMQSNLKDKKKNLKKIKNYRKKLNFNPNELKKYSVKEKIYIILSRWSLDLLCRITASKRRK